MVEIQSVDMEKALFVVAAVCTDKTRPVINHVLIEPDGETSRLVATDGHRAHYATTCAVYEPGLYRVIKKTKKEMVLAPAVDVGEFPDYKQVFPSVDDLEPVHEHFKGLAIEYPFAAVMRAMTNGGAVNYGYFSDACALDCKVYFVGDYRPVVFKGNGTMAVVMPMGK